MGLYKIIHPKYRSNELFMTGDSPLKNSNQPLIKGNLSLDNGKIPPISQLKRIFIVEIRQISV